MKASSSTLSFSTSPPQARTTSPTVRSCSRANSRCSRVTYSLRRRAASLTANSKEACRALAIIVCRLAVDGCRLAGEPVLPRNVGGVSAANRQLPTANSSYGFHGSEQRKFVLARERGGLLDLGLRDFVGVDAGHSRSAQVDVEHDLDGLLFG